MSMTLGATSPAYAPAAYVPPPAPTPEQTKAATGKTAGAFIAPGEKMAAALKIDAAKDVVRAIEERFLQAMLESNKVAAEGAQTPGAPEGPQTGAPRSETVGENRPIGQKDGPEGLTEARGFERQRAEHKRADQMFQARLAETRAIAGGPMVAGLDIRA